MVRLGLPILCALEHGAGGRAVGERLGAGRSAPSVTVFISQHI